MEIPMRILALDPSLNSMGYCDPDGNVSTFKPKKWTCRAHRLSQHAQRLVDELVDNVSYICMESPSYGSLRFSHTTVQLGELRGVLLQTAWDIGVPVFDVAPKAIKKFATGNGNAKKEQVVDAAIMEGTNVANDDEADAWWLWVIGQFQWNRECLNLELTPEREAVLRAIDWKPA